MGKLKIRDVVKLNSGGPAMTVTYCYDEKGSVNVAWFDSKNVHKYANFIEDTLVKVNKDMVYVEAVDVNDES